MAERTPGPDGRLYRKCANCGRPYFTARDRITHPKTRNVAVNGTAWGGGAGLVAGIMVIRVLSEDAAITWSRTIVIAGILICMFAMAGFLVCTGAAKPRGDWCPGHGG